MSGNTMRPWYARALRAGSPFVVVFWIAVVCATNALVPQLEAVANEHQVSLVPHDSPSTQAMLRIGENFQEARTTATATIVMESDRKLGAEAHDYYNGLIAKLGQDKKHVPHIMDLWGNRITAAGGQSNDARASYVLVWLGGDIGDSLSNESINFVRKTIGETKPPAGLRVYVTGAAALNADTMIAASESAYKLMFGTLMLISLMLLLVYRSVVTALLALFIVMVELMATRGIVTSCIQVGWIDISSIAPSMIVSLALGAGTDYAIFLIGRYQEARQAGEDKESAFYTAVRGVAHVILGSGLAISGAAYCLRFTRLNNFQTIGVPSAVAMFATVVVALTAAPAVLAVGSRFGAFDPKRRAKTGRWRRIGASVVRWPAPILVASCALVLIGTAVLPTYEPGYNDRDYLPESSSANSGYAAADRHFPKSRMSADMMLLESDHDLRNTTDLITLERVAKTIFHVPGVAIVQGITRPLGTPMEHTTLAYSLSSTGTKIGQNLDFITNSVVDLKSMGDILNGMLGKLQHMRDLMQQQTAAGHIQHTAAQQMSEMTSTILAELSYFDDYMRPFRNYFYWETNCWELPWCWAFRSFLDALDQFDKFADTSKLQLKGAAMADAVGPQNVAVLESMINDMGNMLTLIRKLTSTMGGLVPQLDTMANQMLDLSDAVEAAKPDDFFYMPREVFANPDFKVGLKFFVSPDGKSARYIITHEGEALSSEGVRHDQALYAAARESLKGTTLAGSRLYLGGSAATYWDISEIAPADFLIAGISCFALVFFIMLLLTRSLVAAIVILGTVAFSFAGAFGLSILIWQHMLGLPLYWVVLPVTFIMLVAVGSDYNLLLVSRFKEEIGAGLKTGLIRSMAHTGGVVTAAGLVFAITMLAMLASDLAVVGQIGSTICIGLLLDTLIVRSFVVPSIAAILGRWFWWPNPVHPRPLAVLRRFPRN